VLVTPTGAFNSIGAAATSLDGRVPVFTPTTAFSAARMTIAAVMPPRTASTLRRSVQRRRAGLERGEAPPGVMPLSSLSSLSPAECRPMTGSLPFARTP
jgi:hypothetical protein